jgi:hypothetical protein
MPVRLAIRTRSSRSSSWFTRSAAGRIATAARTARIASSSCSCGIPKTAMTASPTNFSTVPPWRSITSRKASKYRLIAKRIASGSSRSPSVVEPTTSEKTMVTVLRPPGDMSSGLPHAEQNLASGAFSRPQLGHAIMAGV